MGKYIWGEYPVVAVDFDGVIVDLSFPSIGKINPGTITALNILKKLGCKIIIFSGRSDLSYGPNENGLKFSEMIKFLIDNNIPFDDVWTKPGKPVCDVYIDDHGVRFINWKQALNEVLEMLGYDVEKA